MIRVIGLAALGLLAGCSSSSEPLIDHMSVPDAKYSKDIADCRQGSGGWLGVGGTSVGDCMKGKGYRVLMGTTGL